MFIRFKGSLESNPKEIEGGKITPVKFYCKVVANPEGPWDYWFEIENKTSDVFFVENGSPAKTSPAICHLTTRIPLSGTEIRHKEAILAPVPVKTSDSFQVSIHLANSNGEYQRTTKTRIYIV